MTATRRSRVAAAASTPAAAGTQEFVDGRRTSTRIASAKKHDGTVTPTYIALKSKNVKDLGRNSVYVAKVGKGGKREREHDSPQGDNKEEAKKRTRGRPRKAETKSMDANHQPTASTQSPLKPDAVPQPPEGSQPCVAAETAVKRGRGRPRNAAAKSKPALQKVSTPHASSLQPELGTDAEPQLEPPVKRSRRSGRPSKVAISADPATAVSATNPTATNRGDGMPINSHTPLGIPTAPAPEPPAIMTHQLQPRGDSAQADEMVAPRCGATPLSPRPQAPLCALSPQRRVLRVNGPAVVLATDAATSAPTAGSPRAVLGPRPAFGSPNTKPAPIEHEIPAVVRPEGALSDADIVQIRRLLMPGALPGILTTGMATAAAATDDAAGEPATARLNTDVDAAGAAEPAGRSGQFKELYGLVTECCSTGRGSTVYISGLPGTGKTYTVSRLLAALPGLARASVACAGAADGGVSIYCATVNCMTLDDPAQLYGRLQNELLRAAAAAESGNNSQVDIPDLPTPTDATAAHDSLLAALSKLSVVRSTKAGGTSGKGSKGAVKGRGTKYSRSGAGDAAGPHRRVFVVVLDEVDRLMLRRDGAEELARMFQLPNTLGLSVMLLAVANSLDLTERMMPLLRARGVLPRHMVFTAYSRLQVLAILSAQLSVHPRGRRCFDDVALDMVAKSVSSSSGDLRQALKACRTALDVLLDYNRANPAVARTSVGLREVHTALQRISTQGNGQSGIVAKIKGLPPQQQLVLLALATAVGSKAAAAGGDGTFQAGTAVFTGSRPKFADAVAFREIGNSQGTGGLAVSNPGSCFGGPTPSKPSRPGGAAIAVATTPSTSRICGVMGPEGATPGSCARGPPSRTPASILAGDAGLALCLAEVFMQYVVLCRQLDIPAMSESAFRTDALARLDCDGLLRVTEGRTPAATRLTLRVMVRDVQAAMVDNVMFKRLLGARAPAPAGPVAGIVAQTASAAVPV